MEMLEFVFVYGYLIFLGLLPAIYEYEKALYKSYQEVRNQYFIEKLSLNRDEKLSFHEWASFAEALDASQRYFSVSRNYGGSFFFF